MCLLDYFALFLSNSLHLLSPPATVHIYVIKFLQNSEVYLEPSRISMTDFSVKIFNV